ncbi:MAG: hypothetical protein ABFD86_00975 [Bryobacteraceae bacterium]
MVLLVLVLSTYLLLRPPLFNYDGYVYRLEALQPFQGDGINPHHLLWYPIQRAVAKAASMVGSPGPESFQIFGIVVNSITLLLCYLLLVHLTRRIALPFLLTIFIAFSPQIWHLGLQNQPYPLLDLCVVVFLWAAAGASVRSGLRLVMGGLALAAAVFLQQGMALAVPVVAVGLVLAGPGPLKTRLKLAISWAGGTTLVVLAVYALMARIAGVSPAGFLSWTMGYLQSQHGLQVDWVGAPIKTVIGVLSTIVDIGWLRDRYNQQTNGKFFWCLYGGLALAACAAAVLLLARRGVRERLTRLLRSNMLFTSIAMLMLGWSIFVFLWEPAGYYWSVGLFPVAVLVAMWLRASRWRTVLLVGAALLAASGWNLYADHERDGAYSVSFPPPLIQQIRKQLRPEDVFIVAGKEWYNDIDYDLLLTCMDDWPRSPAWALLDDYVKPGSGEPWQRKLDGDIRDVFEAGGRVFVADHIFWRDTYDDLEQVDSPYSEYAREEYAGVDGAKLQTQIQSFFDRYNLSESGFRIADDRYWEMKSARLHGPAAGGHRRFGLRTFAGPPTK